MKKPWRPLPNGGSSLDVLRAAPVDVLVTIVLDFTDSLKAPLLDARRPRDRAAPSPRQSMRVRHSAPCRLFCRVCHLFHSRLTEFAYSRGARA